MTDVAREAGVSHQTVSRVLNEPEAVRSATRRRVERAIAKLGYRRSNAARSLRTRSTRTIGVVAPGDRTFGPARTTQAVEQAARAHHYATIMTVVDEASKPTVDAAMNFFAEHGVDGIVVIAHQDPVAEAALQMAEQLPVVVISSGIAPGYGRHVVGIDQKEGARLAVDHLLGRGFADIAHISGPSAWFDARERASGWQERMLSTDAELPRLVRGGWSAEDGYQAAQRLLGGAKPPEAVFSANDYMALGIIRALAERGLRVPEDVAVVGFDDVDASDFFSPPLTTIRQPFEAAGEAALDALFAVIDGAEQSYSLIAPELIVRTS
ncbi:LacI family DNA-binding transcriptional regulator [Nesterenkonia sp. NBAIMH1]|uniref:LacI family DNA-binding transcriptional regulator n=1 Tax=Nesterenkonia sp. NBAIMH1 TaxID=2600320 RepID=UPI00143CD5CE|nr:LacI family DNA-binding transcriptional regulator [Nesterenkonia sp. NBAIMH1]